MKRQANTESDSTKNRIIEAAGQVFAQKGFEQATVREICQLATANLAAINYHFGDKQRLYFETVRSAHLWRAQQVPMPSWNNATPPETKLYDFVLTLLTRMLGDGEGTWHSQLMLREMARPNSHCTEMVSEYIRPHFELLLSILDQIVPAQVPARKRHLLAFSVVGQCLHYRVAQPVLPLLVTDQEYRGYTLPLLARHITDVMLAAAGALGRESTTGGSK